MALPLAELFAPVGAEDAGELQVQASGGVQLGQRESERSLGQAGADDLLVRVELERCTGGA